jgi:diguanylate cyclase (GGDEF)-like protein
MFGARLSVSARFMLVLLIGFALQAGISVVTLLKLRQSLMEARTAEVKHLLETAYSTVSFYHDQSIKGRMTDAQAQQAAKDAVRAMHYDNNNYFFIWTLDGVGVAHGSHPEWEGLNLLQPPDAQRLPVVSYMVARLVEVCKVSPREGVTTYRISKYGGTVPLDKIAYTKLFAPWGWSIGTGAYVDDIDATFNKQAWSILRIFILMIAVASFLTFLLGRNLAQALMRLSTRVAGVAKGELDGEVPEIDRDDEVGVMARSLLVLRDTSKEAVELRLDPLTGLPSRKVLMDRIRTALASSARSGLYGGLILVDLDKFKMLNDSQGHDAGDLLLCEVARRLLASVRDGDTVARLGGDEFVVVVSEISVKEKAAAKALESVGEKILAVLNLPFQLGATAHSTSGSVGLTLFKGDEVSAGELLKQTDMAMYKAKDTGRNACRFFDPLMEATVHERMVLEADLRQAIVERQFELYYQPQVSSDERLIGGEALLRWNHPRRGVLAPAQFISMAEETGMILPLGRWVFETACRQMIRWGKMPEMADLRLSINVSSRQFQQADFVEKLQVILDNSGVDPRRLKLELTESLCIDDVDAVIAKMIALREQGVGFSLDDFGTGYSSLAYLKRMPLEELKIDRSFVRDVLTDPNDAAIARTIVALASTLGLSVIAEGVETTAQRSFLERVGCHVYQGFLYSRPVPVAEFEQYAVDWAAQSRLRRAAIIVETEETE